MGATLTYRRLDALSASFAAWLEALGLERGDRVAVMMPNVLQYPVAVDGILRAGMVVVNVNPLYTPRELEHQLNGCRRQGDLRAGEFRPHRCQQAVHERIVQHVVRRDHGRYAGAQGAHRQSSWCARCKKMVPRLVAARARAVQ